MMHTQGPWWKSYDLGTYEIRADGGVVVAKECTLENATAIESVPDMLAALKYNMMVLDDPNPGNEKRLYALALTKAAIAKAEGRTK